MEESFDQYEMFSLNPVVPEIYNIPHELETCDHTTSRQQQLMMMMSSSIAATQELMSTNPACATASSASATNNFKLISFENSSAASSSLAMEPDHTAYYREMSRDYSNLTPQVINFSSLVQDHDAADQIDMSQKRISAAAPRTRTQAQDHLIAERKRREKLGQLFISLSKVVPGLRKLDKASLLEDAINYLKALQERVSVLEAEKEVKGSSVNDQTSEDTDNSLYKRILNDRNTSESVAAPEIKARILNRNVLIKICCHKQKGLTSRIPSELEKMHLTVVDMRAMPFGGDALDITILTEVHNEFRGTVKDIVDHLQMVFS